MVGDNFMDDVPKPAVKKTGKGGGWKTIVLIVVVAVVCAAAGYLYGKSKTTESADEGVCPAETATTTASTSATATALSSGSKYTHKELGFSFTLPTGYVASDNYGCEGACTANISISKKVSDISYTDTWVSLTYNKTGDSLEQMIENADIGSDNLGETDITIDGNAGKKIEVGGFSSGYYYFAVGNGYNLKIQQYPNTEENQAVVDSIVSTFQFTK